MNSIDAMQASLIFAVATIIFVVVMAAAIYKSIHGYDPPRRRTPGRHA